MRDDILDTLATKYPPPFWAFMREFRNAVAFDATRSADALAVGLYRSRGQVIVGFEEKVYRSDWLRELKRPEKAEPIAQFCDFFNVVVPDLSIVNVEELPAPWGLIVVDQAKRKVHTAKKPEPLKPAAITRQFMCAIVKQAMDLAQKPGAEELQAARKAGIEEAENSARHRMPYELKEFQELKLQVEAFQKASGVEINRWDDGQRIGEAVAVVRQLLKGDYSLLKHMEDAHSAIDRAVRELHALVPHTSQEAAA